MLADEIDVVIGVDTPSRHAHPRRSSTPAGAIQAQTTVATTPRGYRRLLAFRPAHRRGPRRCWAIEGTGSFGAGLTAFLLAHGEQVVEIDRAKRQAAQRRQVRPA